MKTAPMSSRRRSSTGTRPSARHPLAVEPRGGLADRMRSIEAGLEKIRGFEPRLADVRYPLERIRDVNRGKMEIGGFQVAEELSAAESVLAALQAGRDPFDGRKGDMERHYLLEGAGEIMPYRVYVPTKYDGRIPFPLIIAPHWARRHGRLVFRRLRESPA
ncbi:MAG: hypothetical protein MZV70_18335 [Desulfobacterales bacterium]|nr:hypothetical protein [Desulfobacterales bacterium]